MREVVQLSRDSTPSPPDFHLCQPDFGKSCAWCCGLYNICDASRDTLVCTLRQRTEEFARTDRTVTAILDFSEKRKQREQLQLLDPEFYACEYVGFLDRGEARVGCMLHPSAPGNEGIDWRGLSFHGAMACQGFFCRAHRELTRGEKRLILAAIDDWYLFGLVISNADLTKSLCRLIEKKPGPRVELGKCTNPSALKVVRDFFALRPHPERTTAKHDIGRLLFLLSKHG